MGKKTRIAGWVLSVLIALLLMGPSAGAKLLDWEGKEAAMAQGGWTVSTMKIIGIVEIVVALLFILPRIGFLGAVLLTAYLGGAVASHARVGEFGLPAIVIGVLVWVALGMRQPAVFSMAMGRFDRRPD